MCVSWNRRWCQDSLPEIRPFVSRIEEVSQARAEGLVRPAVGPTGRASVAAQWAGRASSRSCQPGVGAQGPGGAEIGHDERPVQLLPPEAAEGLDGGRARCHLGHDGAAGPRVRARAPGRGDRRRGSSSRARLSLSARAPGDFRPPTPAAGGSDATPPGRGGRRPGRWRAARRGRGGPWSCRPGWWPGRRAGAGRGGSAG